MALSDEDKAKIRAALLTSKRISVDGLTSEQRSAAEMREILALLDDIDGVSPKGRIHLSSFIPPGSLDG